MLWPSVQFPIYFRILLPFCLFPSPKNACWWDMCIRCISFLNLHCIELEYHCWLHDYIHLTELMNRSLEQEFISGGPSIMRETLTNSGKMGLRLLEDLTALAAGGSVCTNLKLVDGFSSMYFISLSTVFAAFRNSFRYASSWMQVLIYYFTIDIISTLQAVWLRISSVQRTFALDILE